MDAQAKTSPNAIPDEDKLDRLQHAAFQYFMQYTNPANGLVADTSRPNAPCSIAAVGFGLSCYPVGVERGWISREDAVQRVLTTLHFFAASHQGTEKDATGYKGFYYHFLDVQTGRRIWDCELSMVDSILWLAGVLTVATYFSGSTSGEQEIRDLADMLYRRMDWPWAQDGHNTISQGWRPDSGFLHYGWEGYTEAIILYVLGLAAPETPLSPDSYKDWRLTYQWENMYGHDYLYAGPLFIHLFSHAWIDFRGIKDPFFSDKDSDYFENTRRAIFIQQEYAKRNPMGFAGYGPDLWGLTACDGPQNAPHVINGSKRAFFGYAARGVPYGPDDGTIAPWAGLVCLPFTPDIALNCLNHTLDTYPALLQDGRLPGAFNPSLPGKGPEGWVSEGSYGLDQGLVVMMVENYRTGMIWKLMQRCPAIKTGLARAGFSKGWLS